MAGEPDHSLKFNGRRVVEEKVPDHLWADHTSRYAFATKYIQGKTVLDIACGTGYGSRILKTQGNAQKVIGIDISPEAVAFARSRYKLDSIEFMIGSITDISLQSNCFDVVVSFETIEHVNEQEKALLELIRVLKNGGVLIISTPNRKLSSPGKSILAHPDNPFHLIEYTKEEFISFLSDYTKVIEIYGQRRINRLLMLPLIKQKLRRLLPDLYSARCGDSKIRKMYWFSEYRYTIAVCRK